MTRHKAFKRQVRERMAKTGESYTTARRQLLGGLDPEPGDSHRAGVHHATAAFRSLLASHGLELSEAMLFGIGGGPGIGVFSFHYREFSSFFLAGRHLWQDDLAFLQGLAARLGASLRVTETGSASKADRDLEAGLEQGPVIAFVDLGTLGHRGGVEAYYLVVVHAVDDRAGLARISDLAEPLLELPLERLAAARGRIRKFKRRLLAVETLEPGHDLERAVRQGLRACVDGFTNPGMKGFNRNFTLDALDTLAARMRGSGKDGWAEVFPPGRRLWGALSSLYEYIEHYGTGGGLLRPFYAQFLKEAAPLLGPGANEVADRYQALGGAWQDLARAALPDSVPAFTEQRSLLDQTYERYYSEGLGASAELESLRARRAALARQDFPLSDTEATRLLSELAERVEALAGMERKALDALRELAR